MQISQNGLAIIKKFEGFSATPYLCPAGKTTIGYGHVIAAGESFTDISTDAAEDILKNDIAKVEQALAGLIKVPLNQNQFDALVSFTYNIGITAFKNSTMRLLLNINEPALAAKEFARWVYCGGKVLNGLVSRRQDEERLFTLPASLPYLPCS